ncbi:uncharacterized protein LOC117293914 [Asterias rubens]|uniref:uncharacterized protein LOC117293914 n=1 Tax=Asterias rubens TaxID=7604 RepID=UPI001455CF6A|nr:uncharacterized protein LOC117293914 [Asterias rubens]
MDTIRGGWCVLPVLLLAISSFMTISSRHTSVAPWCVMIDYVLLGFEDAINQTKTQKLCHNACKDSGWCESSNYEMASGQCQLLNASHHDESRSLVPSKGWIYSFTCIKPTSPAGQENPDYPCLDMTSNNQDYPIFLTPEDYPSADLTQAKERCAQCDMQLCSLAQLKAAYDVGYRNDEWGLYDTPGRDVKVMPCAGWFNAGECYYTEEGYLKSSIPNTPRVGVADSVYCCDA